MFTHTIKHNSGSEERRVRFSETPREPSFFADLSFVDDSSNIKRISDLQRQLYESKLEQQKMADELAMLRMAISREGLEEKKSYGDMAHDLFSGEGVEEKKSYGDYSMEYSKKSVETPSRPKTMSEMYVQYRKDHPESFAPPQKPANPFFMHNSAMSHVGFFSK